MHVWRLVTLVVRRFRLSGERGAKGKEKQSEKPHGCRWGEKQWLPRENCVINVDRPAKLRTNASRQRTAVVCSAMREE